MLIKELESRYDITRKPLYNRLNTLGIKLSKDDQGRSVATHQQVELLDQLHHHLEQGGNFKNFTPVSSVVVETAHNTESNTTNAEAVTLQAAHPATQLATQDLIEMLRSLTQPQHVTDFNGARAPRPPVLLNSHRELEQAAEKKWVLSSTEVRALIGVQPRGDRICRGCWMFEKAGKIGREAGWRVRKR